MEWKQSYAAGGGFGYKQLAIILEKQHRLTEAIQICQEAVSAGWGGIWENWEGRIERMEKKLGKQQTDKSAQRRKLRSTNSKIALTKPLAKKKTKYLRIEAFRDVLKSAPLLTQREINEKLLILSADRGLHAEIETKLWPVDYGLIFLSVFGLISEHEGEYGRLPQKFAYSLDLPTENEKLPAPKPEIFCDGCHPEYKSINYLRLEALRDVLEAGPSTRKEIEANLSILNAARRIPEAKVEPKYTADNGLIFLSVFGLVSEVGGKYYLHGLHPTD